MRKKISIAPNPNEPQRHPAAAAGMELVSLQDGRPTTTSRVVAEHFGKSHRNVTRAIATLLSQTGDDQFNALNFEPIDYLDARGRKQTEWVMTEQGFALLAMGFTGAKAVALRLRFIKAFEAATQRIRVLERKPADPLWRQARVETKLGHHLIGFALQASRAREGKDTEAFHFMNEAKLVRYAMLGSPSEHLCRDCLDRASLKILAEVEHLNAELLVQGIPYPQRKAQCRVLALELMAEQERRHGHQLAGRYQGAGSRLAPSYLGGMA